MTGEPGCLGTAPEWAEVRVWRKAQRAVLLERRLSVPAPQRAAFGEAITTGLEGLLASVRDATVGFYWPFKGEYDPRGIARSLHRRRVRLALPVVVERARPMQFRLWWPHAPMVPGIWNIPVPAAGEPVVPDVLLVPLVGFDRQGYRLGYGGGYYDRTFAALAIKPLAIGIGLELARMATIYPQAHDVPLDWILTEDRAERIS